MKNTSYRCPHLRKYTSAEGDASNASIADRGSLGREYEEHCILKYVSAEGDASNASIADRGNLGREYEEHYIFAKIFYPEVKHWRRSFVPWTLLGLILFYILLGLDSIQNSGEAGTKHIHRGWSEFWANMKNISYRFPYLRKYTDTEGDASNASIADRGNLGREYEEQYKLIRYRVHTGGSSPWISLNCGLSNTAFELLFGLELHIECIATDHCACLATTIITNMGRLKKAPADGIESGMGRPSMKVTADKKARANAASKAYYQKNAEIIREKRRTQMADKRAAVKAKRRRKDKPKSVVAQTIAMTHALGAQSLTSAEREVSETLAAMWQNGKVIGEGQKRVTLTKTGYDPTQETTDADADDEESSDEEHEPGERRRRAAAYPYTPSPSGGGSGRKWKGGKLRLATPASSSSPEPQGNLPSLYDKLGKARHQRKVPYDRLA
ncbi:hypothetical protein B0H17DRAFT_1130355 [Mycena rosella]|uniref:Uncharacterized protein n=1 Tax=Mycena rosella TaxID=1033263 RepID=A0AAD7DSY4_MYCRO|nr:hypothetical protein B0H17DRAFT_1130355 [Mycena rosella]